MYFEGIEDDFMEELALELDEDTDNVKVTVSYLKSKGPDRSSWSRRNIADAMR